MSMSDTRFVVGVLVGVLSMALSPALGAFVVGFTVFVFLLN